MMFRKTRTHFMGASNRKSERHSLSSNNNLSLYKSLNSFKDLQPKNLLHHPLTPAIKKRSQKPKNFNLTNTDFHREQPCVQESLQVVKIQKKLRRIFKNTRDIVKLLNHWGFTEKGFITRQSFKDQVSRKMGAQVGENDVDQLLNKFSKNKEHIDTQGLISLLVGRSDGIPIDAMNLPTQHNNPIRQKLVNNLKQSLTNYHKNTSNNISDQNINALLSKFNSGISKMKYKHGGIVKGQTQFFQELKNINKFDSFQLKMISHIESEVNFTQMKKLLDCEKNADYLFVDPLVRIPIKHQQKKKYQQKEKLMTESNVDSFGLNAIGKMKSLPNLFKCTLRSQDKRAPFDPISFLNVDQRKTRFNLSQFTSQSNGWQPSTLTKSVHPDQKGTVMNTLNEQAAMKRLKYENKLQKIRDYKQKEQQNILQKEDSTVKREKGHLQYIRNQQQAYNYVNFIKKKWE